MIFAPALKQLASSLEASDFKRPLAYYDKNWTRTNAPHLDHLGAVIDHVNAHSTGGADEENNLVTACNKCNALKSAAKQEEFRKKLQRHRVNAKYGEPKNWDGLSAIFIMLVEKKPHDMTASERAWLRALKASATEVHS